MMKAVVMAFLLLLNLVTGSDLQGQVVIGRQVIGSNGATISTPNTTFSFTTGEAVAKTASAESYIITQGFHQPTVSSEINFELKIKIASCATSTDGGAKVNSIIGCEPPYTVFWSNGLSGESVNRLAPGGYTVTVSSSTCSVTREFVVPTDPDGDCFLTFFTAFSPNGDGVNDVWKVENIFRPEFAANRFEIFNRWGNLAWSGERYDNANVVWHGESQSGNPLPDGTYFFVANIVDVVHKGFIDLTR